MVHNIFIGFSSDLCGVYGICIQLQYRQCIASKDTIYWIVHGI